MPVKNLKPGFTEFCFNDLEQKSVDPIAWEQKSVQMPGKPKEKIFGNPFDLVPITWDKESVDPIAWEKESVDPIAWEQKLVQMPAKKIPGNPQDLVKELNKFPKMYWSYENIYEWDIDNWFNWLRWLKIDKNIDVELNDETTLQNLKDFLFGEKNIDISSLFLIKKEDIDIFLDLVKEKKLADENGRWGGRKTKRKRKRKRKRKTKRKRKRKTKRKRKRKTKRKRKNKKRAKEKIKKGRKKK
jgi:hypothetical protein